MSAISDANEFQNNVSHNSSLSKSSTHNRILVLCIDRDDDIGSKGGIETPIVGRDHCIDAGVRLAIEDPEDADTNAIFAAIKSYEQLISCPRQIHQNARI